MGSKPLPVTETKATALLGPAGERFDVTEVDEGKHPHTGATASE